MAKILLTGSNGFAGRYVAEVLARNGHEVVGLTKIGSNQKNPWLHSTHVVDLTDKLSTNELINAVRPDQVVHLAAISFVAHDASEEIYSTNILGTRNLLEALSGLNDFSGPALIVSSANVYGTGAGGMISETAPMLPANDYGVSKLVTEHLARIYQPRVPSIVLRPFNYTGVGQSSHFLIPKIIAHTVRRDPVIELGNLDVSRDFSDVRFFAEVCRRLLTHPEAVGETFNFCSGQAYSLENILQFIRDISGHHFDIKVNPAFVRDNEVMRLWGDPSKLERLIGPLKGPNLRDTLSWMLDASDTNVH